MAKADIKASSKGISTSADRGSGSEPKWERSPRKRLSAERSLRTSPGARVMVSHLLDPSGKMGRSGEHHAGWIREMGDQKQRLFKGKTPGRELLVTRRTVVLCDLGDCGAGRSYRRENWPTTCPYLPSQESRLPTRISSSPTDCGDRG